jgi:hypothetical protein
MKRCRFCNQNKPALTKAHIIPRSLFKIVRGGAKHSTEMRVSKNALNEKYHQAGHYDCNILCQDCERKFSRYDTHGHSVFTNVFKEPTIYRDPYGFECAYLLPGVDFPLLKLFLLSVLWRASVSRLFFYQQVRLGEWHEAKIKSLIANGTVEDADDYQFVCSHHKDHPYPDMIMPPLSQKIDGINHVHFYLPKVQFLVKVDKRPMPNFLRRIMVTQNPPHYMVFLPFRGSNEAAYLEGMKATIREHWATERRRGT